MRALSQIERTETDRIGSQSQEAFMAGAATIASFAANVSVYRGSNCIFEKNFNRSHLSIGRSLQSDIVLQDSGISRHHVDIYIENQKIFLICSRAEKSAINKRPISKGGLDRS